MAHLTCGISQKSRYELFLIAIISVSDVFKNTLGEDMFLLYVNIYGHGMSTFTVSRPKQISFLFGPEGHLLVKMHIICCLIA